MSSFPGYSFAAESVSVRFREQRVSEALSTRWLGLPRGVYSGFTPQVSAGSQILTLAADSRVGFSSLKVGAQSFPVQVDIFTKGSVTLNFSGHTQYPIFVIARADYARDTHTRARIFTRTTGASGPQEINICQVDKPNDDLVVDASVPASRHLPVAFQGQAFGYMLPGAAEDIVFAQTTTAEVSRARYSIATPDALPPTPSPVGQLLADRLALDLAADYLAAQIGLRCNSIVGNAKIVAASSTSVNVSGSFASTAREFEPKITIAAGGNETTEGAIVSPDNRNICFLVDDVSGHRVIDADRHPVYGRLGAASAAITGTLDFQNAQTTVMGSGTNFTGELEVGDIILGADGSWYEVAALTAADELELSTAYLGADVAGVSSSYRRFTLLFYTRASGAEVSHALVEPVTMRFFFPAWFRADRSIFDALAYMKRVGERPALGGATDATAGRIQLAVSGSKAGAIHTIRSSLVSVGSNFHTLNFSAANAAITPAGTGVANITVPGDRGINGVGADTGDKGLDGPAGVGGQQLNSFETNGTLYPPGSSTMTIDFSSGVTPTLSGNISHVVGGFARFSATVWGNAEGWKITNIWKSGALTASISFTLSGNSHAKFFLGASV